MLARESTRDALGVISTSPFAGGCFLVAIFVAIFLRSQAQSRQRIGIPRPATAC
jgi:hypothetical protein